MMSRQFPSIYHIGQLLRRKELTPAQLVEGMIKKIKSHEQHIHAWVFVDEAGARRSAQLMGELLMTGTDLGPLHGIPIGVKDIVDVEGWPTLAGSTLRAGHVAHQDADVVTRLRRAGAIILGKTVTTEFACFDPSPTRNPWNREHTPGGSSSGSAAAIATEMCLLAVGSQTGGSIVRPASFCGVAGLKPSIGRVSTNGAVPVSAHLDHVGPIGRYVSDLAIGFGAMTGEEPDDAVFEPQASHPPTLGVLEPYFFERADSDVIEVTRNAIRKLRGGGAPTLQLQLPASFPQVHKMHRRLMAVDAAEYHRHELQKRPAQFGPNLKSLLEEGLAVSGVEYSEALAAQRLFRQEVHESLPIHVVAITPSTPTTAPSLATTGDPRFNSPWSFAGVPTVTIPCGQTPSGMPCGLQLISRHGREQELLVAAAWCEWQLAQDNS